MNGSLTRLFLSLALSSAATSGLPFAAGCASMSGNVRPAIRCSSVRKSCIVSLEEMYLRVLNHNLYYSTLSGLR